jgi:hypothetical protein
LACFDTQPQGAFFFFYEPTFRLAIKGAAGASYVTYATAAIGFLRHILFQRLILTRRIIDGTQSNLCIVLGQAET